VLRWNQLLTDLISSRNKAMHMALLRLDIELTPAAATGEPSFDTGEEQGWFVENIQRFGLGQNCGKACLKQSQSLRI
jgi:hypothetical protein